MIWTSRRGLMRAVAGGTAVLAPGILRAQAAWPDKPITIIVNFAPGGLTDGIERLRAPR